MLKLFGIQINIFYDYINIYYMKVEGKLFERRQGGDWWELV